MRVVRQIMGMPISIDIPLAKSQEDFEPAFERLHQIDAKFSTYKADSEVSKYINGRIEEAELSGELKMIIKKCREAETQTDGYFSAWAAGVFDPLGYIKGWAIAEAGQVIEQSGYNTYCIGAAGDILARSDADKIWSIGIQDPKNPKQLLDLNTLAPHQILSGVVGNRITEHQDFGAGLSTSNGAVATSGNYERGAHIINPKTKQPAHELASVTITGPDIIWADVLATAVFAMGAKGADFMKTQKDYQAFIV